MGTLVQVQVVTDRTQSEVQPALNRALAAIRRVETICSRFDPTSELMQLSRTAGSPVAVSDTLFEALRFAREVAEFTDGRFDPTIGRAMEKAGFDRHYLTAETVDSTWSGDAGASYRDLVLNSQTRTVYLKRPLVLDLGAVAKGLGIDLAVQELRTFDFQGFSVDAGGDVHVDGLDEFGEPWLVGIKHPIHKEQQIAYLRLTDAAVCTSGSYERVSSVRPDTHHILDPNREVSPRGLLSVTAVGPFAMMCDAFSTAAFLYGAHAGLELLDAVDLAGITVTDALEVESTESAGRYLWDNKVRK